MSSLLISAGQLQTLISRSPQNLLVIDVRTSLTDAEAGRRDYEAGHLPGALHIDLNTQLSGPAGAGTGRHPLPERSQFAGLMRQLGLGSDTQVVVYDEASSLFAARLWWMLRWIGHEWVAILDGGWRAWQQAAAASSMAGRQQAAAERPRAVGDASAGMPLVDMPQLQANLVDPRWLVVDARAPERFRGETEPLDPVAGHIPGAVNRPATLNLQIDGSFKPSAQLRAEFLSLIGEAQPAQVVHQCGSGVTACHNLFAMELAGLTGSRLYPGSWSQWCSDAANPVALGAA